MMEHKEFIVSISKGRYCLYLVLIIIMAIFGALFGMFSVIEENWTFLLGVILCAACAISCIIELRVLKRKKLIVNDTRIAYYMKDVLVRDIDLSEIALMRVKEPNLILLDHHSNEICSVLMMLKNIDELIEHVGRNKLRIR